MESPALYEEELLDLSQGRRERLPKDRRFVSYNDL
jgi:hypothetical protein